MWKNSRFYEVLKKARYLELADIGRAVKNECGELDYEIWALMLWKIWTSICRATHDEMEKLPMEVETDCIALWEAYQAARPISSPTAVLGVCLGERVWRRPKQGMYRVDVDVLFHPEINIFGVGIIIRDHKGEVVVAMSKPTKPYSSVMIAEMMAIAHAILVSLEYQVAPVEIFTDSLLTARTMVNLEEEDELLPDDVHEILEVARQNMLVGVYHMYRSANRAAHSLAQFVRQCSQPMCWTTNFPSWLRDIVSDDVS